MLLRTASTSRPLQIYNVLSFHLGGLVLTSIEILPCKAMASLQSPLESSCNNSNFSDSSPLRLPENLTRHVSHYQLFQLDFERIRTPFAISSWLLALAFARICMSILMVLLDSLPTRPKWGNSGVHIFEIGISNLLSKKRDISSAWLKFLFQFRAILKI